MKTALRIFILFAATLLWTSGNFAAHPFGFGWKSEPPGRVKAYYHSTAEYQQVKPLVESDYSAAVPFRMNQGGLGSCVAHGSINGYAVTYWSSTGKTLDERTVSRLGVYYDCRDHDGSVNRDAGSYISTGAWVLKNIGIGTDKTWPYVERNFKVKPPKQYYIEAPNTIAVETLAIDASTANGRHKGIIAALSNKRGVVMGGLVDNHIFNTGKDGFEEPYQAPYVSGHCRAIIGHKDDLTHKYYAFGKTYKGFYLVVNSWGADWGKNGLSWVPYETIDNPRIYDDFVVYITVKKLADALPQTQKALASALIVSSF